MSKNNRCCNRQTCPYYQGTDRQHGTTPYTSANEGTSTQFLYFGGSNFNTHPSCAEVREFQDCISDTEVTSPQKLGRKLCQAASSLNRTDSGNYIMTLRQIIALTNRLLEHIERKTDNGDPHAGGGGGGGAGYPSGTSNIYGQFAVSAGIPGATMGHYPQTSPTFYGGQQQTSMGIVSGKNVAGPPSPGGSIPLDLRMLRIEPVTLTVPFTIHFQSQATIPGSTVGGVSGGTGAGIANQQQQQQQQQQLQQQQQQQQQNSNVPSGYVEPIRTAMIAPSQQTRDDTPSHQLFPYTSNQQTDLYISKGKFPPLIGQSSSFAEVGKKPHEDTTSTVLTVKQGPPFATQPWVYPKTSPTLSSNTSAIMEIDKAVQTEKYPKIKDIKSIPTSNLELETGDKDITFSSMSQTSYYTCHSEFDILDNKRTKGDQTICDDLSIGSEICEDLPAICKDQPKKQLAESEQSSQISERPLQIEPFEPIVPPKPTRRMLRLALPQHQDLCICNKCRFSPSPLFDEDGNVFCPGKCGCCLCPWKGRTTNSKARETRGKIKVCKCRERLTIFTDDDSGQIECSTTSYDFCPCRERAEAKFLELYGHEMYNADETLTEWVFGDEVAFNEVVEIRKEPNKRMFSSS